MTGLRERKKQQTRDRIARAAVRLFRERGYEAVTVAEVAEAAEVARATLFAYFPTKEALVLDGVGEEDLAGTLAARPAGTGVLDALDTLLRGLASSEPPDSGAGLTDRLHVVLDTPALQAAAEQRRHRQRHALAAALAEEFGEPAARYAAAQITAVVLALQEAYFARLGAGAPPGEAARTLAAEAELALGQLRNGLDPLEKH